MVKSCTQRRPTPNEWQQYIMISPRRTSSCIRTTNYHSDFASLTKKAHKAFTYLTLYSHQSPARITISNSNSRRNYQRWKTQGQPTSRDCLLSRRNPLKLGGAYPKQKGGQHTETSYFICLQSRSFRRA